MANDLLKKLEDKINEAIETIELAHMEVSDLKEQNEELENRYADWEAKLSTLIEKFEQLEDSEDTEVKLEESVDMENSEEESEEEVEAEAGDTLDSEDAEDEQEIEVADTLDSEDAELEDLDDEEELGSTFGTNADSFNEAPESAQHYA